MNRNEWEQGRRVRLMVDLEGGQYKAGDTGYLNRVLLGNGIDGRWGVVFDRDADNDMRTTNFQLETLDGCRAWVVDVVEPIADDLSEDTQELKPIDDQFIEAAHEMELIKQLAAAQDELDKATAGNTVTFNGLIRLNDKRDSAVKALINFCRDRWLSDPVHAPSAEVL